MNSCTLSLRNSSVKIILKEILFQLRFKFERTVNKTLIRSLKGPVRKGDVFALLEIIESEHEATNFNFKRMSVKEPTSLQSKKETF